MTLFLLLESLISPTRDCFLQRCQLRANYWHHFEYEVLCGGQFIYCSLLYFNRVREAVQLFTDPLEQCDVIL